MVVESLSNISLSSSDLPFPPADTSNSAAYFSRVRPHLPVSGVRFWFNVFKFGPHLCMLLMSLSSSLSSSICTPSLKARTQDTVTLARACNYTQLEVTVDVDAYRLYLGSSRTVQYLPTQHPQFTRHSRNRFWGESRTAYTVSASFLMEVAFLWSSSSVNHPQTA